MFKLSSVTLVTLAFATSAFASESRTVNSADLQKFLQSKLTESGEIMGEGGVLLPGARFTPCTMSLRSVETSNGPELTIRAKALARSAQVNISNQTPALVEKVSDRLGQSALKITVNAGLAQDFVYVLNSENNLKSISLLTYDLDENNDYARSGVSITESVTCSEFWSSK
jgi:hypothetical protein